MADRILVLRYRYDWQDLSVSVLRYRMVYLTRKLKSGLLKDSVELCAHVLCPQKPKRASDILELELQAVGSRGPSSGPLEEQQKLGP